jgi:putative glutamine amidotransferase
MPRESSCPNSHQSPKRPVVGITTDVVEESGRVRALCNLNYAQSVADAGGIPVFLPPIPSLATEHARHLDAFVFTGGDDVRMEDFGVPTHPAASPVHRQRQAYEVALLDALRDGTPDTPVLGICLGMQIMSVHAGATLNQHLPDTTPSAAEHKGTHGVSPLPGVPGPLTLSPGEVSSSHHQAIEKPGPLRVLARSEDGVIEAVTASGRKCYVGVQWHPERTEDPGLGLGLFKQLIDAARR